VPEWLTEHAERGAATMGMRASSRSPAWPASLPFAARARRRCG